MLCCSYCPGGPDSDFEYSTQSYTGYEPTSMRAIRARYNPYLQTRHRVEQVCSTTLIIMTFIQEDCVSCPSAGVCEDRRKKNAA